MKFIRGLNHFKKSKQGLILTVGNFDGVHLGHQFIIDKLNALSKEHKIPSALLTFEPQPQEFFHLYKAPGRLSQLREKINLLAKTQLDYVICETFNEKFAAITADDFIKKILIAILNVKYLIIGNDFRFGFKREGDFKLLQAAAKKYDFKVINLDNFEYQGERVSSTHMREALLEGNLPLVKALLGRNYSMLGRIVHGDKRGRTIGFPTANIPLRRNVSPIHGVFAVLVHGLADKPLKAVANVGKRPTVGGTLMQLEVHLFDFDADIYGRQVEVEFIAWIRDEKKFASFDELKTQIAEDAIKARETLF